MSDPRETSEEITYWATTYSEGDTPIITSYYAPRRTHSYATGGAMSGGKFPWDDSKCRPATGKEITLFHEKKAAADELRRQHEEAERKEAEAIKASHGIDPQTIGLRPRGFWVLTELDYMDKAAGASLGDLCIKARDGGGNQMDPDASKSIGYVGTIEDDFDCTYRYYYYRPVRAVSASDLGLQSETWKRQLLWRMRLNE